MKGIRFISKKSFVVLALLLMNAMYSQIQNKVVEAIIETKEIGETIQITAVAHNKTNLTQSIQYKLSVIRSNPKSNNQSKNDQTGRGVLVGYQRQQLSMTSLDRNTQDRIIVLLLVYDENNNILGSSRYVLNDHKGAGQVAEEIYEALENPVEQPVKAVQPYAEIRFSGLVIDETKTKAGRDFYQLFYSSYLANKVDGEKVVVLRESLTLGNSTKITIKIEEQLVFEFFVRPQYDYIKSMAEVALRRVTLYFENLKRETQLIKRF
ncbi:CsgE family curli-type amyloid fiber assembly protein [Flavobacterium sp. JP2137]|uniref:CsgE family curli-type amyloid fiber assembly protein n=1 Tax=Flavobacterium sp. JP2137 TaxID=3414510 RepID=UPI003D30072A